MIDKLRNYVGGMVEPIARLMVRAGFTANMASAVGFMFSLVAAHAILSNSLNLASILILISGFFDLIDGAIARVAGRVSKFGSFLDSVIDRYSDATIVISVILSRRCDLAIGLIALVGFLMVSYARAKGEMLGVNMAGVGIAERAERLIILAIGAFVNALNYAVLLLALLTHITVLMRSYRAWRVLRVDSS